MLTAERLAALEAHLPPPPPPPPREADTCSSVESSASLLSSIDDSRPTVGVAKSSHALTYDKSLNTVDNWIIAAATKIGKRVPQDLVLDDLAPNDALASQILEQISDWYVNKTTATEAEATMKQSGPIKRHKLNHTFPDCGFSKARNWMFREINALRATRRMSALDDKWGRHLADGRANARTVNKEAKRRKIENGSAFHHKHDVAPTNDQLAVMTSVAFTADERVHHDELSAAEAGMAIALYLPSGARGAELKGMHLQSLGYESIEDTSFGSEWPCIKMTAFECKTKEHHLNQFLAHVNPWRCGVGALGISILLRYKLWGKAPPVDMGVGAESWSIIGSDVSRSFDSRLENVFGIAGVRRQSHDPLTYLGRHFGTRLLQHAGGSAEGGAARTGHTNGSAQYHYTEVPLEDLLLLKGVDPNAKFEAAHLKNADVKCSYPLVDEIIALLIPEHVIDRQAIAARQLEIDKLGKTRGRQVRTTEQLNDRERVHTAIHYCLRVALLCLVARRRHWQRWTIIVDSVTFWYQGNKNRVIARLFGGNALAIQKMNELAHHVMRAENAEIMARETTEESGITTAMVEIVEQMQQKNLEREKAMLDHQKQMFEALMAAVGGSGGSSSPSFPSPPPPEEETRPRVEQELSTPLASAKVKHARNSQDEIICFSKWTSIVDMIKYTREAIVPKEKEFGWKWRIRTFPDGRQDKSIHKQWTAYVMVVCEIGRTMVSPCSLDDAISKVDAKFKGFRTHRQFVQSLPKTSKEDERAFLQQVLGL